MTKLVLVRHGQATHNLEHRWQGWGATPLTPLGVRQAEAVAQRLAVWEPPFDHLYTSPLLRARQTSMPIARKLGLTAIEHQGLRELDFGQINGLTADEFQRTWPQVYERWQDKADLTFRYPGGEQRLAFFSRVGAALDEILAAVRGQRVVIVSHGGTIRASLAHLFPDTRREWWAYKLANGSLTHIQIRGGEPTLVAQNDAAHLQGLESHEKS